MILLEGHRDEASDGDALVARAGRKAASQIVRELRELYPKVSEIFAHDIDMKSLKGF